MEKQQQNSGYSEWDLGLIWGGIRELSKGDGNILYFDRDLGYTGVYVLVRTQWIILMVWTFHGV